ncbi:MAG: hypothetical protein CMQ01_06300 [Gammaproteobacteria bacterium]|nr:hypothetical protein [Gammaproteobacteria bacterium]
MMSEIYLFKLTTGEEVIGSVADEIVNYNNINTLLVNKPMILGLDHNTRQLGGMPWMPLAKNDKVTIIGSAIIAISRLKPEIEKSYLQQISGIDLSVPSSFSL